MGRLDCISNEQDAAAAAAAAADGDDDGPVYCVSAGDETMFTTLTCPGAHDDDDDDDFHRRYRPYHRLVPASRDRRRTSRDLYSHANEIALNQSDVVRQKPHIYIIARSRDLLVASRDRCTSRDLS